MTRWNDRTQDWSRGVGFILMAVAMLPYGSQGQVHEIAEPVHNSPAELENRRS